MKKLSKEDIQFIENYLENSDIRYADIRMEMTDHVASAIETQMQSGDDRGFYYIFKDYMIVQKSKLLESNKKFVKNTDKTILKHLAKQLNKPSMLIVFVALFLTINHALNYVELDQLQMFVSLIPILSIIPFLMVYFILIKRYKLSRFSGVERLGFTQVIMFYFYDLITTILGNYIETSTNHIVTALSLALIITISLSIILLTITTVNQYRREYRLVS